jgi:HSP20 family molecular chaperone IbpA
MSDFFEDDTFEDILEQFFRGSRTKIDGRERFARGETEERVIDALDDEDSSYLIFELPGYEKEDVNIETEGRTIEIIIEKKNFDNVKEYLSKKLSERVRFTRNLPITIYPKSSEFTMKNGILEIKFKKKNR